MSHSPEEIAIYRQMTPSKKLQLIADIHLQARAWKKAALRTLHPEWTEDQLNQKNREVFLYGSD